MRRQEIIQGLVQRLSLITLTNNYSCDAGLNVQEWRSKPIELYESPLIVVKDTKDIAQASSGGCKHQLKIDIVGSVEGETPKAIAENLRKLTADILLVVSLNDKELIPLEPREYNGSEFFIEDEKIGQVSIEFTIIYYTESDQI